MTQDELARPLTAEEILKSFGEPRYSVSDLQRAYAEGFAAATPSPTPPEGLREALVAMFHNRHHDQDCERTADAVLRLLAASPAPDPGADEVARLRGALIAVGSVFRLMGTEYEPTVKEIQRQTEVVIAAALSPSAEPPETA